MFLKKFIILFLKIFLFSAFILPSFNARNKLNASNQEDKLNASNQEDKLNTSNQEDKLNVDYLKNISDDFFYILGTGDVFLLHVSEKAKELNQIITINDQGVANLKRLGKSYIKGLTVKELSELLQSEYSKYVIEPSIKISILKHRPVKFYIDGEVEDPGIHILPGSLDTDDFNVDNYASVQQQFNELQETKGIEGLSSNRSNWYFPTIVDALRKSGGITSTADLENITVSRINKISDGGGRISTSLNLLNLINLSDTSQDIRILDGDTIFVKQNKSPAIGQISKALKTNINPKFIQVFIGGRVEQPGVVRIDKSAVLIDAIDYTGGIKVIKGPVRFLRYKNDGTIDKRKFRYNSKASRGSYKNPYLRDGDLIFVGKSPLNVTSELIQEFSSPIQGIVSTYGLYKALID